VNFYLQPEFRPLLHVRRRQILGHEAFVAAALCDFVGFDAIGSEAMRKQQDALSGDDRFECFAPIGKRLMPQIFAVSVETIEDRVDRRAFALLKKLKTRDALAVEHHHFAIEEQGCRAELFDGRDNFRKTSRVVLPVARKQANVRALLVGEQPIAVVLFFIHPAGLVERLGHERCEHGLHAEWDLVIRWHDSMRVLSVRALPRALALRSSQPRHEASSWPGDRR